MALSRRKVTLILGISTIILVLFQNCTKDYGITTTGGTPTNLSTSIDEKSGSLVVSAARANPPLDLFFIIDNSASMLGHQIDLATAFSTVFTSNTANLSNFDVNIYVMSTASTVNSSYMTEIPSAPPSSFSSVPSPTDTADLAAVPGSIFAMQIQSTGTYGTAPYSEQINPAVVLDVDQTGSSVTPVLHIAAKGSQSTTAYQNSIQATSAQFQHRIEYLNPTNQLSYESLTDISSGMCSLARVLRHSSSFVNPGDAAAFIIVSDDNDRLNVRNPNGNTCMESTSSAVEVVDGTCGHYETTVSYDASATVTYQTDTKFSYQSGTTVPYSYTNGVVCSYQYSNGYKYTSTYTAVQTGVTYTKCTESGDGTCLTQETTTQTIPGNYVNGSNCTQDMTSLIASPVSGTTFECAANNLANQAGASGVDASATATTCSSTVLASLQATNHTNVICTPGAANLVSTTSTQTGLETTSCSSFCSAHPTYTNCALSKTNTTSGMFSFPANVGITCNSTCPVAGTCGTGTILQYLTTTYGSSASCPTSPGATMQTLTVSAASNATPAYSLTLASSLSGLVATTTAVSGTVCAGQSTVQSCITSLQNGTPTVASTIKTGDQGTVTVPTGVTCTTSCANSDGFCTSTYPTVAAYLAQTKNVNCLSAKNGGATTFPLRFNQTNPPAVGANTCASLLCSNVAAGSSGPSQPGCDGMGYGVSTGATVADYAESIGGSTTCTASTAYVSDVASVTVPLSSATASPPATSCSAYPNSPIFKSTDVNHAGGIVINHTSGSDDLATDMQTYIVNQATSVFGANNLPAVAVITQLPGDNLPGTDVGQDYINLARAINGAGAQVSGIRGNYGASLSDVSSFIVTSSQNNFVLPVPSGSTVDSVAVVPIGSAVATPLTAAQWTWTGSTLSVSSTANLQIGDQLNYDYH